MVFFFEREIIMDQANEMKSPALIPALKRIGASITIRSGGCEFVFKGSDGNGRSFTYDRIVDGFYEHRNGSSKPVAASVVFDVVREEYNKKQ